MKELLIEIRDYLKGVLLENDNRVTFFSGRIEEGFEEKDGDDIIHDLEAFVKRIDEAVKDEPIPNRFQFFGYTAVVDETLPDGHILMKDAHGNIITLLPPQDEQTKTEE